MRVRVLPALILAITLLLVTFLYAFHRTHASRLEDVRIDTADRVVHLTRSELLNYSDTMSVAMTTLTGNDRILEAFADGDRASLTRLGEPLFLELQKSYGIDHFYFHLPDRTNLLRLHDPEHSGDRIDRHTLLEAERTGKVISGIEQGPTGNCTLRVVRPFRFKGKLIGYVELGTEFETVARRVRDILDVHLIAAIEKRHLNRTRWETRNAKLGRQTAWDAFPDFVIIDKTMPEVPSALAAILRRGLPAEHAKITLEDSSAGTVEQITFLPLTDVSGNPLGRLIAIRDITSVSAAATRSVATVSVTCAAVGAALVTFFYVFLGRVQRDLDRGAARLKSANAQLADLNRNLESRIAERSEALENAHLKLVEVARQAGMAEVATGVLHNIGNVMNSINVAAEVMSRNIENSEVDSLSKLASLVSSHEHDLPDFLTTDERGKLVPAFLNDLSRCLQGERQALLSELDVLSKGIGHIKQVVAAQQSFARGKPLLTEACPVDAMETALTMQSESISRHRVRVIKHFEPIGPTRIDEHRVLQVLINLIANAVHAVKAKADDDRLITLTVDTSNDRGARVIRYRVRDSGVGIAPDNLSRIFSHGFTTRADGHGFGLHSAANAACEMGGELTVHSDGPGLGATFTLQIPAQLELAVAA